jgi:hypothetical protein
MSLHSHGSTSHSLMLRSAGGPRFATPRSGARWTLQELKKLKDMRAKGATWADCALALGRSQGSVFNFADRHDLVERRAPKIISVEKHGRPWTGAEIKVLREHIERGCTIWEVSNILGRSYNGTKRQMRANNIKCWKPDHLWKDEQKRFLFDNPNMSNFDIGKAIGKTEHAVAMMRTKLGIRRTKKEAGQ